MNRKILGPIAAAAFTLFATGVMAYDSADYQDWTAETEENGGATECTARTGGDGDPTLSLYTNSLEMTPPDLYPGVTFSEVVYRNTASALTDGMTVTFDVPGQGRFTATAETGLDEYDFPTASATVPGDTSLPLLKAMRAADSVRIVLEGETDPTWTMSLNGFTAAYGKMAEYCGFTTVGVID